MPATPGLLNTVHTLYIAKIAHTVHLVNTVHKVYTVHIVRTVNTILITGQMDGEEGQPWKRKNTVHKIHFVILLC